MQKNSHLRKLVFIAFLTAQGIVLGLLEQAIPFPFAPGAKLGLANIVTLISLYTLSFKEVVFVIVMKTLLTTVLGGTFSTFLYSGMGALVSFIGMYLVKQLGEKRVSMIGVSATGGILHNVGQLMVASWMAKSWTVLLYLPAMSIVGIFAGIAVGVAANYALAHIKVLQYFSKIEGFLREKKDNPMDKSTIIDYTTKVIKLKGDLQ